MTDEDITRFRTVAREIAVQAWSVEGDDSNLNFKTRDFKAMAENAVNSAPHLAKQIRLLLNSQVERELRKIHGSYVEMEKMLKEKFRKKALTRES